MELIQSSTGDTASSALSRSQSSRSRPPAASSCSTAARVTRALPTQRQHASARSVGDTAVARSISEELNSNAGPMTSGWPTVNPSPRTCSSRSGSTVAALLTACGHSRSRSGRDPHQSGSPHVPRGDHRDVAHAAKICVMKNTEAKGAGDERLVRDEPSARRDRRRLLGRRRRRGARAGRLGQPDRRSALGNRPGARREAMERRGRGLGPACPFRADESGVSR